MTQPKSRRRPPILHSLAWFIPGLLAVGAAGLAAHPLTLIPLLLANSLTMAAICHAIGFDPEPRFTRTVLRRGAAHLVMFTGYSVLVFLLVAWPMLQLSHGPSLSDALLLAAALVLALAVLWRLWPAFGLVFVWDDAYPPQRDGSWIFTATLRSMAFGRHLSREERFFSHFLPAALCLLILAFGAIALTGLVGMLPQEMRIAALAIYAVLVLPLACLIIANRTLRALLCERHAPRRQRDMDPATAETPRPVLTAQERLAGTAEQAAALLAATRDGDIERALALLEAAADPGTAPTPEDRDQRPVLVLAALLPDTRLLRALIAKGADVNRASGGITALLAATRDSLHGRAEAVLTLLANGADASVADTDGNTALHYAARSTDLSVAAALLDAGAPIDALNQQGQSALVVACHAANWPVAELLLKRRAKLHLHAGEPPLVAAASLAEDDPAGIKLLLKHRAPIDDTDANQRTALMAAAAEGHARIAAALRGAGANVALADRNGCTALMEAARAGADEIVSLLGPGNPGINACDLHGRDALTLACQSPHATPDTVRILLALVGEPDGRDHEGRSALDHAAAAGRWDLVALLDPQSALTAEPDPGAPALDENTSGNLLDALRGSHWPLVSRFADVVRAWPGPDLASLYLALAEPGHGPARRWLLDHGLQAEEALPSGQRLFDALLPLLPESTDAVRGLLDAGASPAGASLLAQAMAGLGDTPDEAGLTLILSMFRAGADPFGALADGRTPMHLATAPAWLPILQQLADTGANPSALDAGGCTPLHIAVARDDEVLPAVRVLLRAGADPEASAANGETPLGLCLAQDRPQLQRWLRWTGWRLPLRRLRADDLPTAAATGDNDAVDKLLELGFPVDTADLEGATALIRGSGHGHLAMVQRLLDADANHSLHTHSGMTALAAAAGARHLDIVALLTQRGAPVDQALVDDTTALMLVCALGHADAAEALSDNGADVNHVDAHGRSALHAAAQYCFASRDSLRARRLLDVLLTRHADVNRADVGGCTPLLLLLGVLHKPGFACDGTHLGALVPVLLDAGVQVDHADQRGVTALHACAMHALLAPARILLSRGASRAAVDAFGRTAAEVAHQLGFVDIAHELSARNASAVPSVRQTLRQPAQPD
ncbi:MAG TPA: ankyrin repeat domain-containing protein [Rhodanobacter sp.]|nr:ankyrin repeat domain-containing protein [Rhodanobacter sp.]